jgi:hypothetical protein
MVVMIIWFGIYGAIYGYSFFRLIISLFLFTPCSFYGIARFRSFLVYIYIHIRDQ